MMRQTIKFTNTQYNLVVILQIEEIMLISKSLLLSCRVNLSVFSRENFLTYQSSLFSSDRNPISSSFLTSIHTKKHRYCFSSQQKKDQKQKSEAEQEQEPKPKSRFEKLQEELNKKSEKLLKFLSTLNSKSYYKILRIFILTLFPSALTYLQFFDDNAISSSFQKIMKERKQNLQAFQGKKVEEIINQKQKTQLQNAQKQLAIFQSNQYDYKQRLDHLLQMDDSKLIVFIESFFGSAVGTNLKRLAWDKVQKSQDEDQKNNKKKIFKNIYYVNLKEPCLYSISKDDDNYWEQAKDLNFLLSSIIGSSKKSSEKGFIQQLKQKFLGSKYAKSKLKGQKSILIIDEVQILQHFLKDQEKKKKLEQLYQKISYVQRKKNIRVFLIANNNSFFARFNRQLQNPNLEDFKYEYIKQMSDDNIRDIIRCRSKIDEFYRDYPTLKVKFESYFDKIVDYIVQNINNTRQIVRIIKEANIDFKEFLKAKDIPTSTITLFWKKRKQEQFKQWIQLAEKQIKKQFKKVYFFSPQAKDKDYDHYLALKKIRRRIVQSNQQFLQQKKRMIIDQIDQSSQKTYNGPNGANREDIINSKITILILIFCKKFESIKEAEQFLYNMNKSEALAYQELNKAQIIHGLNFSSKLYERAFYFLLEEHKQSFKKLLRITQREFNNHIQNHRKSIENHNKEVKEMESKFEQSVVKNI